MSGYGQAGCAPSAAVTAGLASDAAACVLVCDSPPRCSAAGGAPAPSPVVCPVDASPGPRYASRSNHHTRRIVMGIQLGDIAPDFEAETTEGKIRFHEWIGD